MKKIIFIIAFILRLYPLYGQVTAPGTAVPVMRMAYASIEEVPQSVDNSKLKFFPPLISQIGGSCAQASNVGYMFTYEINRLLDRSAAVPENRFSYLYTWNFINDGQDDGSLGLDGIQLALSNGIITEKDFPAQNSFYPFYWASGYGKYLNAMHYRAIVFRTIEISTPEGIQQAKQFLYNRNQPGKPGGILTFSTQARGWTFNDNYQGPSLTGYKSLLTKLANEGPHAMTIVGYDDTVEYNSGSGNISKGAFIVINTWGRTMHDNGRFYLPYSFFMYKDRNNSELSADAHSVDVEYRQPQIVFKVAVECDSRNDLSFRYGVSGKASDKLPTHDYQIAIANYQGGDFNMQGAYSDATIEMGFDFTNAMDRVNEMKEPKYFLTIERNARGKKAATKAILHKFEVIDYRQNKTYTYRTESGGTAIKAGTNLYGIATIPAKKCSRSPVKWLNDSGQPAAAPFIIRTHDSKFAKIRMYDYDREKGTIKIKYVYNQDGGRRLK